VSGSYSIDTIRLNGDPNPGIEMPFISVNNKKQSAEANPIINGLLGLSNIYI
jgi:hypothetical protein